MKTIIAIALLLLVGCKSEPTKSYFLSTSDTSVMWIEWTLVGDRIEGQIWKEDLLANGSIKTISDSFDAEVEGENFRIILKPSPKDSSTQTSIGSLKGDTMTLAITGSQEFNRVSRAECFAASRKLADRAEEIIRAKATPPR